MKSIFTTLFICLMAFTSFAQRPGGYGGGGSQIKGKVSGVVYDGTTNEPVPYATVVLRSPKDNSTVNGMITNEDGSFKLNDINVGTYKLEVSFVGYTKVTQTVELTPKSPDIDIERITIQPDSEQLDEVVVAGQRETIENKIDRIVYNAEQDVANAGGDASDVLRRTPLLSVDQDGNVSLRGSQNIQILINGKPSSMFGSSPGDALKMIPSDQIKSVEVITSPSAKYDGEGTAGIINIITKKKTPQGFAGNVDATVGTRINREVVGINAGVGRFGFSMNGSSFQSWPQTAINDFYQESTNAAGDTTNVLRQFGGTESYRIGYFGNASAFYDFNAYHSLSTSVRLRGFNSSNEGVNNVQESINGTLVEDYQRFTDTESQNAGYEWSLDYVMKFPEQEGRELSLSYKIDGNINDTRFLIQQDLNNTANAYENAQNDNDGNNRENTIQVDYVHPMGEKFKVETGFKSILRDITSDFSYQFIPEGGTNYQVDPDRTDVFNYNQDVYAGYVSTQTNITKKLGVIAGVRYEFTDIAGSFDQEVERNFDGDTLEYDNWLPSIIVSQKFGKTSSLKLAYNRRISRPSLRNVNPYIQIGNVQNISFGNPSLAPEVSDNVELGYNTFFKGTALNISTFYNTTNNVIQSITNRENGQTVTQFDNIGTQENLGANLFVSTTFFKIWTLRTGINANYVMAEGFINGRLRENNALLFSGNLNSNLKLPYDITVDAFGFARPRQQTLQGFNPGFSIFGIGAKKELWDGRGSIGISIIEPFQKRKPFESEVENENFYQRSVFEVPFRSFGINFSYKFGKLDYKARQRRSRINNNDQQSDGDQGQSF